MLTCAEKPKTMQPTTAKASSVSRTHGGHRHDANPILDRQRTISNCAGNRLLQTEAAATEGGPTSTASAHFGHDFSRLSVHSDAAAEQSARDINAHAYTVGQNIMFGFGQFAPKRASASASKTPEQEQSSCQDSAAKATLGFAHDFTRIPVNAQPSAKTSVKSAAKLPGQSKDLQPKSQPEGGVSFGSIGSTFGLRTEPDLPGGTSGPVGFGPYAPPQLPAVPAGPCPAGTAWVAGKHVTPNYVVDRPTAKRSNTAPSTTDAKDPTYTGEVVVDCPGKAWRYQIKTVESKGTIQIVYYEADHYPAPTPTDDSGALSNVTKVNWKDITKDLDTNKTGVPDFWSAYKREVLHEDYHWNTEWQGEVNKEMPKAEAEIEKLKVDFTAAATASDAEKTLKPGTDKAFKDAMTRARAAYDALGDSPGDPPYVAQAPALEALSKRVKDHATAQKW